MEEEEKDWYATPQKVDEPGCLQKTQTLIKSEGEIEHNQHRASFPTPPSTSSSPKRPIDDHLAVKNQLDQECSPTPTPTTQSTSQTEMDNAGKKGKDAGGGDLLCISDEPNIEGSKTRDSQSSYLPGAAEPVESSAEMDSRDYSAADGGQISSIKQKSTRLKLTKGQKRMKKRQKKEREALEAAESSKPVEPPRNPALDLEAGFISEVGSFHDLPSGKLIIVMPVGRTVPCTECLESGFIRTSGGCRGRHRLSSAIKKRRWVQLGLFSLRSNVSQYLQTTSYLWQSLIRQRTTLVIHSRSIAFQRIMPSGSQFPPRVISCCYAMSRFATLHVSICLITIHNISDQQMGRWR